MNECTLDECKSPVKALELCNKHYERMRKWGTTDAPKKRGLEKCTHPGCDKPHHGKGYCLLHYSRYRNGTDMDFIRVKRFCTYEGCEDKHYSRGWCKPHYERWKVGADMDGRPPTPLFCTVEECSKPYHAKGLCVGHYQRSRINLEVNEELLPRWGNHEWRKHSERECNQCGKVKPYSEFYPRARSTQPQAKCKECFKHLQMISKYRRGKIEYPTVAFEYFEALGIEV